MPVPRAAAAKAYLARAQTWSGRRMRLGTIQDTPRALLSLEGEETSLGAERAWQRADQEMPGKSIEPAREDGP